MCSGLGLIFWKTQGLNQKISRDTANSRVGLRVEFTETEGLFYKFTMAKGYL